MPNAETMKLRLELAELVSRMLETMDAGIVIAALKHEVDLVRIGERAKQLESNFKTIGERERKEKAQ